MTIHLGLVSMRRMQGGVILICFHVAILAGGQTHYYYYYYYYYYYCSVISPSAITGKVSGLCRIRINSATRNSSVNKVTRLQAAKLRNRHAIAGKGNRFSLLHNTQTDSGIHPASYSMGKVVPFTRVKVAEA